MRQNKSHSTRKHIHCKTEWLFEENSLRKTGIKGVLPGSLLQISKHAVFVCNGEKQRWYSETTTTEMAAAITPENNDLIGRMRKSNSAVRSART